MQVVVVHNPGAGGEAFSAEDLVSLVVSGGHAVSYRSTEEAGWESALREAADLYVAAGGDGTIRKVIIKLAGTGSSVGL